MHPGAINTIVC